jgi:hypothetical protein
MHYVQVSRNIQYKYLLLSEYVKTPISKLNISFLIINHKIK